MSAPPSRSPTSPSGSTPPRWRRDTAARISAWSCKRSRGSGGADGEIARQPKLAEMERRVPDALDESVAPGDLMRLPRAPELLRRQDPPVELCRRQGGARHGYLPRQLLEMGDEGACI